MTIATLTWADVDPARHPFDPGTVHDVVRAVAPAGGVPAPFRYNRCTVFDPATAEADWSRERAAEEARWAWQQAMDAALVEHYEGWAAGWNAQMGGRTADGVLVLRWNGARDSITTPEETLEAVAGALLDWRAFLEDLAELFARHLPLPAESSAAFVAWEATVAALVAAVAARSGADEHWYPVCSLALKWFLDVAEVPGDGHDALVEAAVGGRFWSSVSPQGAEVADAAESLAAALTGITPPPDDAWPDIWPQDWPSWRSTELPAAARAPRTPPPVVVVPDTLAAWRRIRREARWEHATGHVEGPVRTHRDGIAEHFAKRGCRTVLAALALVREDANAGGPLTFARLQAWQQQVLGTTTAGFRTTSAWARAGRERYAYRDDLPAAFEACLAEATDPLVPLPSRAARVFLDVLFFHPFADGNARSAALALYFVLGSDGVVLARAAPLLMTRWSAADPRGAEGLARFVAALIEQTRR
ncbi:Fic family protein [Dactylosporangium sp. NPDC050688]|uniref:Fic family protein n=1 Tax=Dactylosporangium sp. NPDC050688 TaxID=3157217 RepID=UPI003401F30A